MTTFFKFYALLFYVVMFLGIKMIKFHSTVSTAEISTLNLQQTYTN